LIFGTFGPGSNFGPGQKKRRFVYMKQGQMNLHCCIFHVELELPIHTSNDHHNIFSSVFIVTHINASARPEDPSTPPSLQDGSTSARRLPLTSPKKTPCTLPSFQRYFSPPSFTQPTPFHPSTSLLTRNDGRLVLRTPLIIPFLPLLAADGTNHRSSVCVPPCVIRWRMWRGRCLTSIAMRRD